jgi:hypothetical protein
MYKLREQRLKEFYTTGEVLSDVLSTSTSSLDGSKRNVGTSNLKSTQRYEGLCFGAQTGRWLCGYGQLLSRDHSVDRPNVKNRQDLKYWYFFAAFVGC